MKPSEALFKYANVRIAMPTYEQLLAHAEHHDIKGWLLAGAKSEDARTLFEAINRQPPHRLQRKLAEMLADK